MMNMNTSGLYGSQHMADIGLLRAETHLEQHQGTTQRMMQSTFLTIDTEYHYCSTVSILLLLGCYMQDHASSYVCSLTDDAQQTFGLVLLGMCSCMLQANSSTAVFTAEVGLLHAGTHSKQYQAPLSKWFSGLCHVDDQKRYQS